MLQGATVIHQLDYEDVAITLSEHHVDVMREDTDSCDMSFSLGANDFALPIIVSYKAKDWNIHGCKETSSLCGTLHLATIANQSEALVSNVDLEQEDYASCLQKFVYIENNKIANKRFVDKMRNARKNGKFVIAGCSLSTKHCMSLTIKSAADAVLVGSLCERSRSLFRETGLSMSRITLIEELSNISNNTLIFATVENSSQACKALVAGADAVVLHFEALPTTAREARMLIHGTIKDVSSAIRNLCELAQVSNYKHLKYHCKLVPRTRAT